MHKRLVTMGMGCWFALIAASPASGATTAYEKFSYTSGANLEGQLGGGGFTGAWSGNTGFAIGSGSLIDPTGMILAVGNRVSSGVADANKDIHRDLTVPVGAPGTTSYFSWLIRPEGTIGAGFDNGHLGLILSAGPLLSSDLFVGRPGTATTNYPYVLENVGGTQQHTSSVVPVSGQTVLMVLRADFTAGNDTFRLYINPSGDGIEPITASATKSDLNLSSISRFYVAGPGAFSFDELHVGTTYDSVTTNALPEPAGPAALLLVGITGMCRRRR